ncbi:MAG: nitroreductase family protein [Pseudomonadota bacterium]
MDNFKELWAARFGTPLPSPVVTDTNPVISTLLSHRTHRQYTGEAIAPDQLTRILAATFSAPSKSDLQQVSLVHLASAEKQSAAADLIPSMPWIRDCAEFFVFCADGRRIVRIAEMRGKPFANDNLDNFIASVCDVGLAIQAFITAAESLGLGCCPISVVRDRMDDFAQLLSLPERVIPVAGMCLGHPARAGFVSARLPVEVMCHTDSYDDSNLEAEINAYDQLRDSRFSLPEERQKYRDEFGTAAFYSWSEDKARQMAKTERASVTDFVKANGFSLN